MSEPFSRQRWLLRQLGVGGRGTRWRAGVAQALACLGAGALLPAVLRPSGPAAACIGLGAALVSAGAGFKLGQVSKHSALLASLLADIGLLSGSSRLIRLVGKVTKVYVFFVVILFSAWLAYPWISGDLKLLLPYWAPFETDSFLKFSVMYFFSTVSLLTVSYTQEAVDTIFLLIAAYLCRRLAEVKEILVSIGEENYSKETVPKPSDEELLKKAISEHIEIIRLIREFDKILTDIFLIQVLQSTVVSTMCFYAASKITDVKEVPKYFTILMATYMQLYIYCWLGEEISNHNDEIHRGIYMSKWYQSSLTVKKSVNIVETFTKTHFKLNGGLIFTIHLETFLLMVKESFSYFMVLRAIVK